MNHYQETNPSLKVDTEKSKMKLVDTAIKRAIIILMSPGI